MDTGDDFYEMDNCSDHDNFQPEQPSSKGCGFIIVGLIVIVFAIWFTYRLIGY